jgi:hypothetical protein
MRLYMILFLLAITTPVYAQTSGSSSGASSMVDINSPANTTNRLITTPTVAAPGLTAAGVETCLGSASGGLSLMGGGITFGSTRVDDGCTIRLLARQLYAFGFQKAAMALMCEDKHVVIAMATVDSPCPSAPAENSEPVRVSSLPQNPSPEDEQAQPAESSEPVHTGSISGGYILDLKPANIGERVRVSFIPHPFSQEEEEAWFDRETHMN